MRVTRQEKFILSSRHRWRTVMIGIGLLSLTACGTPSQYMGISLRPGAANPEIQQLASRASAGDKQAQLELGIAFEQGRGVSSDMEIAMNLYQMAATDQVILAYSPATGGASYGTVHRIVQPHTGLQSAQWRLACIKSNIRSKATQIACDNNGIYIPLDFSK